MKNNFAGSIYLIPTPMGGETLGDILPNDVLEIVKGLRHFVVEDLRSARRFLRKVDREFPIDDATFFILNKKERSADLQKYIAPALAGRPMGVLSEAGCPGVADPGAEVVDLAHQHAIPIRPLVGPSSILLTLMGSGMNGQEFTFHGYLPKDRKERIKKLKELEFQVIRTGSTQLFMDTPFRNMNVLDDLLNELADQTHLCIAFQLTTHQQRIETMSVEKWRENAYDLAKSPVMFALGVPAARTK